MSRAGADRERIDEVLAAFPDPETGDGVLQSGQVRDLLIDGDVLRCRLGLSSHSAVLWDETRRELAERLRAAAEGLRDVDIQLEELSRPPRELGTIGLTVKSVVAVGSGKGGVGKSTVAAALALGLQRAGSRVGLMDADVYGPSIPHLIGADQRPQVIDGKLSPVDVRGLKVMSMGFLVAPGEAVVWRGPMLHGAITQFLRDTQWGQLDYLVIDMPPGTGDIALTLSQLLPLSGAVVVCTPQDVALLDAVKAIAMFRKVNIPLLGLVENMSYFLCPGCGQSYDIFGRGGARRRAQQLQVPFLGEIPLQIGIRVRGDEGRTAENFDDPASQHYLEEICRNLVRNLGTLDRAAPPPLPTL